MVVRSLIVIAAVVCCVGLSAVPNESSADSDIGLKGIGGRLGIVDPQGAYNSTVTFGMVFDFGTLAPGLHWDGAITYWRSEHRWPYYPPYYWDLGDLALRTGLKYYFLAGEWHPLIGGGLGIHNYRSYYNGPPDERWPPGHPIYDDMRLQGYLAFGVAKEFSRNMLGSAEIQVDMEPVEQTAVQFNLLFMIGRR